MFARRLPKLVSKSFLLQGDSSISIVPTVSGFNREYAKGTTAGVPSLGKALKKGKLGKGGPALEKKVLPVETDPVRLASYVCGSCITKTGEDIKLKDVSEYPEWLWKLNTGKPLPLEELDPDTEYYWKRVKRMANTRSLQLQKLKKF